ncbi:MAG: thioredoxin [Salinivirgaceae bacterium]|nr:thioredoxin [Salinivirgaceae bacterium]
MTEFQNLIKSEVPVLIDFYTEWCAPCRMMPPILKQVKDQLGDQIRIIKIDTDKNPALSAQLQIRSIPTMMLFKNGEKAWQTSGVMQASQLIATLKHYLN